MRDLDRSEARETAAEKFGGDAVVPQFSGPGSLAVDHSKLASDFSRQRGVASDAH
jgi:hypothetical protein